MNALQVSFRRASLRDAYLLLDWRNDPETRAASLNGEAVQMEDHLAWLSHSLERVDRQIFVAEASGRPIGTIRLDCVELGIELSWTIAPECRGQGLGRVMVIQMARQLPCTLVARIKAANTASRKIARACGMKTDQVSGLLLYQRPGLAPADRRIAADGSA